MALFGIGTPEIIIILLIVLLLFGGRKLPELGKAVGQFFKELKSGFSSSKEKNK